MGIIEKLDSNHIDILREIGNIGAGNAATSLSKLINKKIDMTVPEARIVSFEELMNITGDPEELIASVFLRVEGDTPGSMYFILPLSQAEHLTKQITGKDDIVFEPPFEELALSALQEAGNILTGSYLSSLADFTNLRMFPSVPQLSIDMIGAVISYGLLEISKDNDQAIVIDTVISEQDGQLSKEVKGHLIMLPDPESFLAIFKSLGVSINE